MLIGAGVLGWSVDSASQIYKVQSSTQNVNNSTVTETSTVTTENKKNVDIHYNIDEHIQEQGKGAPELKPFSQHASEE
jgi:hypothetical protein